MQINPTYKTKRLAWSTLIGSFAFGITERLCMHDWFSFAFSSLLLIPLVFLIP
jgi:hypothetical protein